MKKKGFTLVELLAVIAILAILVIIAIPNVLNLYRNARNNVFLVDAQSVLITAKEKYLEDSITSTPKNCYSSVDAPLDLDAKSTLEYKVEFSATTGDITSVKVQDKNYSAEVEGDPVKIDALKNLEELGAGSAYSEDDLKCTAAGAGA